MWWNKLISIIKLQFYPVWMPNKLKNWNNYFPALQIFFVIELPPLFKHNLTRTLAVKCSLMFIFFIEIDGNALKKGILLINVNTRNMSVYLYGGITQLKADFLFPGTPNFYTLIISHNIHTGSIKRVFLYQGVPAL